MLSEPEMRKAVGRVFYCLFISKSLSSEHYHVYTTVTFCRYTMRFLFTLLWVECMFSYFFFVSLAFRSDETYIDSFTEPIKRLSGNHPSIRSQASWTSYSDVRHRRIIWRSAGANIQTQKGAAFESYIQFLSLTLSLGIRHVYDLSYSSVLLWLV
jgi:hypothetical protein